MNEKLQKRLNELSQELVHPQRFTHEFQEPRVIPLDYIRHLNAVPGNVYLPGVVDVPETPDGAA